jgi:hypothetical protein
MDKLVTIKPLHNTLIVDNCLFEIFNKDINSVLIGNHELNMKGYTVINQSKYANKEMVNDEI